MVEFLSESEPFELRCWVPQYGVPTSLTFQFGQFESSWEMDVMTRLTLRSREKSFESSFGTYREQLRTFADSLREISSGKAASICLMDEEYGEMVLCFCVSGPGSGRVTFGGRLICERFYPIPVSVGRFVTAFKTTPQVTVGGIHIVFDGLETDQTYLHQLGTAILWFLNQLGPS